MARPVVTPSNSRSTASASHSTNAQLSAETRRRLTDVACALVVREGYANLTLDSVARAAEVSKGGLLYHFPSKRALLKGMIEDRCREFEEQLDAHLAKESGPGRVLRALIHVANSRKPSHMQESAAIFAVLANDSELLSIVRKKRERFFERLKADELDPVDAMLIVLTVDGICFSELLDMGGPSQQQREKVVQKLLAMTSPKGGTTRERSSEKR